MSCCDWCGHEAAVLFPAELLVRGVRCYIARFMLCRHCLPDADD
jgi:hypothetical protein